MHFDIHSKMTGKVVQAAVDCGSSYYLITYKWDNNVHMVDIQGNPVQEKVPSIAYLPISCTDIKKPPYNMFHFGNSPGTKQEMAFIPNWKNYFFDADEVVNYPNVPSVPSKNHRSVRVLSSALFEAFMESTVQMLKSKTSASIVELKFLIPSIASDKHEEFLNECARAVKSRVECRITLVYEAEAALVVCNGISVGDFGGFTFDKASQSKHEACNLAASNVDEVIEELVRAECIDLRFRNRELLYERILKLKEGYGEEAGDVILEMTDIFYPLQLLQHKLTKEIYDNGEDILPKSFSDYISEENDKQLYLQYYQEMKGVHSVQRVYADFRRECLEIMVRLRKEKNEHCTPYFNAFCEKYSIEGTHKELFENEEARNEMKEILLEFHDYEHIVNNGTQAYNMLEALFDEEKERNVQPQQSEDELIIEMGQYMFDNEQEHWLNKLKSGTKLVIAKVNDAADEFSGVLIKEYILEPNGISIKFSDKLYKSILEAVCDSIVKDFAEFLTGTGSKEFRITGNFCKSEFLLREIVNNDGLKEILISKSNENKEKELIKFLKNKWWITPEVILSRLLDIEELDNIKQTLEMNYSHYVLDIQGRLIYIKTEENMSHKGRICIDEGTSGSLLSCIPANTKFSDDMPVTSLPEQKDRKIDDLIFKAGAKIPSFCLVNVPLIVSIAMRKFNVNDSYLKNAQNVENLINRFLGKQMLSISEIQRIFLYGSPFDSRQPIAVGVTGAAAPEEAGKKLTAKEMAQRKKMKVEPVQPEEQDEPDADAAEVEVEPPNQFNEPLIIEYWKRHLYAKEQVRYPFEPTFEHRYTYNDLSININFPIAYFYIAHLMEFYKMYQQRQTDMIAFYNQIGITLTVPCAAKEQHLTFLRECARYANLPDDLVFVYEPNSAFSYLFYYDHFRNAGQFTDEQFILVIDVGAGTTDISLLLIDKKDQNKMPTFNVVNFYEINFAGNNIIDEVIESFAITADILKALSSTTKSSFRESIKSEIEYLTNQSVNTARENNNLNLMISNRKNMSDAEKAAYEELKQASNGHLTLTRNTETDDLLIDEFEVDANHFIYAINKVQNLIFEKAIDFCKLNKSMQKTYEVFIVCAGGMGSSTYFNESMKQHVAIVKSNSPYISYKDVKGREDSIAVGGLYLKAEKDYVDFSAPLITRGKESENDIIKNSPFLSECSISIITFMNIDMKPMYREFTFIQKGERCSKSAKGEINEILTPATYSGIEFVVFVGHRKSATCTTLNIFAYLIRVPQQGLQLLHEDEEVCAAGVPEYLYEIDCELMQTRTEKANEFQPYATIEFKVRVAGTEGEEIACAFDLQQYISTNSPGMLLSEDKDLIELKDTIYYSKMAPFLKEQIEIEKQRNCEFVFKETWILKLPDKQWYTVAQ